MASDAELLEAWRSGDRRSGERLFERHFATLYRFFCNKTAGSQIDDLVQETFASCLAGAERLREDQGFRGYLLGIARHKLIDSYRARSRTDVDSLSSHEFGVAAIDAEEQNQERRILLRALRRLRLQDQVLLELAYWEGLKDRELAQIHEIPIGTVKSRLRKARGELRHTIEQVLRKSQFESTVDSIDAWLDSMRHHDVRQPQPRT